VDCDDVLVTVMDVSDCFFETGWDWCNVFCWLWGCEYRFL